MGPTQLLVGLQIYKFQSHIIINVYIYIYNVCIPLVTGLMFTNLAFELGLSVFKRPQVTSQPSVTAETPFLRTTWQVLVNDELLMPGNSI